MTQQSIFDQVEQAKQTGIELVYRHASTTWKRAAADRLYSVIQKQEFFTSDDVLIPLEKDGEVTGDNRAIAAILQAFSRAGLITATDRFITCKRKSRHHAPVRVWQSKLKRTEA